MHDGIQYDPIQCLDYERLEVGNPSIFNSYILRHLQWELATDHRCLNYDTISKFDQTGFLIFDQDFVSLDFEVGTVRPLRRVDRQSCMGLIYLSYYFNGCLPIGDTFRLVFTT